MRRFLVPLLVLGFLAAACGGGGQPQATGSPTGPAAERCAKANLTLLTDGQLTIGTDNPAFQPWFGGTGAYGPWKAIPSKGSGNPASGKGFESAVAYAIAEQMGFTHDDVRWVAITFNESFKPGQKDFDFDINEVSFNEKRAEAVDFSQSYYNVAQALVAKKGTPITQAKTFEDLKQYKLGAQIGTTSYGYIVDNVKPDKQPAVYDKSVDVIAGLNAGQIDGYVTDAPTAYVNVLIGQAKDAVVVGQFPQIGPPEYFGLVFEMGNALVDCVNRAIGALKSSGTLKRLESQWLEDVTFPEFKR